jgi:large subunit ribosomal protein L9
MKVLLLKDVKGLGKKGEIKEVKDGYGRNFVVGKGYGVHATNDVIKKYEAEQREKAKNEALEIDVLRDNAKKIEELTVSITKKIGANGSLFGAITKEEIAEALNEQHKIDIDKKAIDIKNPIKMTGLFEIDVKLGHGIHSTLKLDVMGE